MLTIISVNEGKPFRTYVRIDGMTVREYQNGNIVSLVAYDLNGRAADNWDGNTMGRPARFFGRSDGRGTCQESKFSKQ